MTSAIVPRPIALVTTRNNPEWMENKEVKQEQLVNVAPFSYYNAISSSPACIMLSITKKPDQGERLYVNIVHTKNDM